MNSNTKILLVNMFEDWAGEPSRSFVALPPSGSYREYFRISGLTRSAIGVFNTDFKENSAFLTFSRNFKDAGLNVPEIYGADVENHVYLQQDLGDITLYAFLQGIRKGNDFPQELVLFYKKSLEALVDFQIKGRDVVDFNTCYPRAAFDRQSMLWDLHYFKYYFLKLARVAFDEQLLEDDYNRLIEYLLQARHDYFLYRDFQSRNIMVCDGTPWFVDYQGGRRGALQYDVASLLFDAKADIPAPVREELLEYYMDKLSERMPVDRDEFRNLFYGYVYIRIMQAMGAYGFRGFYERKEHFLKSIPYAIQNLEYLFAKVHLPIDLPALMAALHDVTASEELKRIGEEAGVLTVSVNSFSYKRGIPVDVSGNGGGFVFDCRAIHNPGKYPQYQDKTGKDDEVVSFFEKEIEMTQFLEQVKSLVGLSVSKYSQRGFKNLMVNFGCTGGQHRSVYCAEQLASFLKKHYHVIVLVRHLEQEMKSI